MSSTLSYQKSSSAFFHKNLRFNPFFLYSPSSWWIDIYHSAWLPPVAFVAERGNPILFSYVSIKVCEPWIIDRGASDHTPVAVVVPSSSGLFQERPSLPFLNRRPLSGYPFKYPSIWLTRSKCRVGQCMNCTALTAKVMVW